MLVVHWQYTDWPDHGVPDNPDDFLNFFHNVRLQLSPPEPVFVHCSAGVGRTGVTIALDSCMAMIEQRISVNPIVSTKHLFLSNSGPEYCAKNQKSALYDDSKQCSV